ncbi:hypothetical protein BpHYR1_016189 [Brachionus plicatilis]|uniref:Uncharacterized protein n=1 Tax=Brachionus plicatilis TaxID=10195 RepID=A0A3M7R3F5_BRAPC|nr:hypothetical protein BpHYR1_016189 [Brachionus plicatilis]
MASMILDLDTPVKRLHNLDTLIKPFIFDHLIMIMNFKLPEFILCLKDIDFDFPFSLIGLCQQQAIPSSLGINLDPLLTKDYMSNWVTRNTSAYYCLLKNNLKY